MSTAHPWLAGYLRTRAIGGTLCGVQRFAFTWGLAVGLDAEGYSHRYCYADLRDALEALDTWDGQGHPPGPWIKLKGLGAPDLHGPGCVCGWCLAGALGES